MRRDHFHTDDGVPIRRLPNGRPKPFTDDRVDEFVDWLEGRDHGSRNEPAAGIWPLRVTVP